MGEGAEGMVVVGVCVWGGMVVFKEKNPKDKPHMIHRLFKFMVRPELMPQADHPRAWSPAARQQQSFSAPSVRTV